MKKLFLFFLCLIFCNCSDDSNPVINEKELEVIQPLEVGNEWNYIDSSFNAIGEFIGISYSKLMITGSSTIKLNNKNKLVYYWNWFDNNNEQPESSKWLCGNRGDGFYFYGFITENDTVYFEPTLYAKYPIDNNDEWNYYSYMYFQDQDTSYLYKDTLLQTCISTNKILNTPSGKLDCIVYRYEGGFFSETEMYFSKGLGYVASIGKINGVIRFKKVLNSNIILDVSQKSTVVESKKKKHYHPFGLWK